MVCRSAVVAVVINNPRSADIRIFEIVSITTCRGISGLRLEKVCSSVGRTIFVLRVGSESCGVFWSDRMCCIHMYERVYSFILASTFEFANASLSCCLSLAILIELLFHRLHSCFDVIVLAGESRFPRDGRCHAERMRKQVN